MACLRIDEPDGLDVRLEFVQYRNELSLRDCGVGEIVLELCKPVTGAGGIADGDAIAQALIKEDPELDIESVGMFLKDTKRVWVGADGKVCHAVQHFEIVHKPDGSEARRPKAIHSANVGLPLAWSGKLIPRFEAVRKFVFCGMRQIKHVNGLTYDFLFDIARELAAADALLLVGAGSKSNQPLVFRRGSLPYRGFLEGRTEGAGYMLLLHLSNMELKSTEPDAQAGGKEAAAA